MSISSVKEKLAEPIRRGNLSHAYIITGGSEQSRDELAVWLAEAMQCTQADAPCGDCSGCKKTARDIHPDVSRVVSEKQWITVDLIREMASQSIVRPNEGRRRIFIIPQAERLNVSAQNAMLKVLEDPPATATFILLCRSPKALLQTVRSRCVLLQAEPESEPPDEQAQALAGEFFSVVTGGGPLELCTFCTGLEKKKRDEMSAFLRAAMDVLREGMIASAEEQSARARLYQVEKALDKAYKYCAANVGSAHIAGYLSVSIHY